MIALAILLVTLAIAGGVLAAVLLVRDADRAETTQRQCRVCWKPAVDCTCVVDRLRKGK